MSDYSNFLHRLIAYRDKMNLTQEAMAELFGVHQSHYGRYESGSRVISFKSLKKFEENGGDLFQLLTGCKRANGPVKDFLSRCPDADSRKKMLELLIWGIEFGSWMDQRSQDESAGAMRKCIRLMELRGSKYSVWEGIRKVEDLTQIEMAKLLDVEVKRYRRIEKEETDPDVEILCTLYDKLQYSPQLFFDAEQFYIDELNFYWNLLAEDTKAFLGKIIEAAFDRIYNRTKA